MSCLSAIAGTGSAVAVGENLPEGYWSAEALNALRDWLGRCDWSIVRPGEYADVSRMEAIFLPDPLPEAQVTDLLAMLPPGARVIMAGAERREWDGLKARLVERETLSVPNGHWLWSGAAPGGADAVPGGANLPMIVSYYTAGTQYEQHAQRLIASLRRLNLPHLVVPVQSFGCWERNCSYKPSFILEMWQRLKTPIIWVDADATAHALPLRLADAAFDFAINKYYGWKFASGTLYFNQTPAALRLLQSWVAAANARPLLFDQVTLTLGWWRTAQETALRTAWLPRAYTQIFDIPREPDSGEEPVFVHHQASRLEVKQTADDEGLGPIEKEAARFSRPCVRGTGARFGASIRPSPTFEEELGRLARNRGSTMFFLQVGAMDGKNFDPLFEHVRQYKWQGLLIEPLPDMFERLRRNYADCEGLLFENCAVTDTVGEIEIHRVPLHLIDAGVVPPWAAGISSLYPDRNAIGGKRTPAEEFAKIRDHIETQRVRGEPLPSVLARHRIERIDLLQIDTEGHDYRVLRQFDFDRYRPELVQIEIYNLPEQERRAALKLLVDAGYEVRFDHKDAWARRAPA